MDSFLNARRLRDYPRLFWVTTWILLLLNVVFHHGWLGASGQLIGTDFIMLYSGGKLARQDVSQLYNFEMQEKTQKEIVSPTEMWGLLPFNYPPYVAFIILPLTFLPLAWAMGLWSLATIFMGIIAARLMYQHLTSARLKVGLSQTQLVILVLSFFAFVEGLLVGQNHGLTLLLMTAILVCMQNERWALAGICAGLSMYKPQFAAGFLVLWLVWGKWRALAAYALTALVWAGSAALAFGIEPFVNYIERIDLFLKMLYLEGFGTYLEVTPYGLLISLLPASGWKLIVVLTQLLMLIFILGLAGYAWRHRRSGIEDRLPALILASLFPLLAAPHTLLHDLVILIPALLIWARWHPHPALIKISAAIYLAAFLIPWIAYVTGIPFLALIPLGLVISLIAQISKKQVIRNLIPP